MRILICSLSSALGGMERRLEAETRLLVSAGHDVFIATPRFPGFAGWRSNIEQGGGQWIFWRPYKFIERRHFAAPFRGLALATIPFLLRRRIDAAHLAIPWNFVGLSMAYVLQKAGIPLVIGIHCKFSGVPMVARGQAFARSSLRSLIGGYAVSTPARDAFMRLYDGLLPPNASIQVIPNGIDVNRFRHDEDCRAEIRSGIRASEDQFIVMFCGRLEPMKRPLLAIRIIAALLEREPRARMLIVGDGPEMPAVRLEVKRLGIERSVTMTGAVADTARYYAAADCYLSTSVNMEGCPLATAEALATELPAVVPDDDVFRDIYGQCSGVYRCDPGNQLEWVEALLSIAVKRNTRLPNTTDELRRFVTSRLSLDTMNQRLQSFYRYALSSVGRR